VHYTLCNGKCQIIIFLYILFNPSSKGADGDKIVDIAFDSSYFYYCSDDWSDGQADIWKRVSWNQEDTW
jgi:hypothetical protein